MPEFFKGNAAAAVRVLPGRQGCMGMKYFPEGALGGFMLNRQQSLTIPVPLLGRTRRMWW